MLQLYFCFNFFGSYLVLGFLFLKEIFLTDVPKVTLNGFGNKSTKQTGFFWWPKSTAKVKSESFSINGFDLYSQKL